MRERDRRASVVFALVVGLSGCAALFGIDDPAFDACAVGCTDASVSDANEDVVTTDEGELDGAQPGSEASAEASAGDDASADTSSEAGVDAEPAGVRCGPDTLRCLNGPKPYCCETIEDGGAAYTCTATACGSPGYSIQCATSTDCVGSYAGDDCCHFGSAIKCEPPSTCPSTLVCDPSLPSSCPAGKTCSVSLQNLGQPSPYWACSP